MKTLFEDVNLAQIDISRDGMNITLTFVDMHGGNLCGKLECVSVFAFNYHNNFLPDGNDGFACYVFEVTLQEIPKGDIESYLKKMNYGFNSFTLSYDYCNLLHIEGGDVIIDVLCHKVVVEK